MTFRERERGRGGGERLEEGLGPHKEWSMVCDIHVHGTLLILSVINLSGASGMS